MLLRHRCASLTTSPATSKHSDVGNPSMELLAEVPGIEVVDLAAGCCGMAGTFGMKTKSYQLSLAVGAPLFERIGEVAPDLLASECSTCRMQLAHATGLPVVHPSHAAGRVLRSLMSQ